MNKDCSVVQQSCPICGAEGTVTEHTDINDSEYRRGYLQGLLVEYSLCSFCGSEFAGPDQINRNAQRARERMQSDRVKTLERNSAFNKPIHAWIDEWALESLRERDRAITLRKKLYGKPTENPVPEKIFGIRKSEKSKSRREPQKIKN